MTNERDALIERVMKLMAMAADASSPNEAAIAARRARALMDKHQIPMEDLKQGNGFASKTDEATRKFTPIWEQSLAVVIARYNDCVASFTGSTRGAKQLRFDGVGTDVDLAVAMFSHVRSAIVNMCGGYLKGLGYTKYNARLGTAFKLGAVTTIRERLEEATKDRLSQDNTGTGLLVIKQQLVAEHFKHPGYRDVRSARLRSEEEAAAVHIGREMARSINMTASVN